MCPQCSVSLPISSTPVSHLPHQHCPASVVSPPAPHPLFSLVCCSVFPLTLRQFPVVVMCLLSSCSVSPCQSGFSDPVLLLMFPDPSWFVLCTGLSFTFVFSLLWNLFVLAFWIFYCLSLDCGLSAYFKSGLFVSTRPPFCVLHLGPIFFLTVSEMPSCKTADKFQPKLSL